MVLLWSLRVSFDGDFSVQLWSKAKVWTKLNNNIIVNSNNNNNNSPDNHKNNDNNKTSFMGCDTIEINLVSAVTDLILTKL